MSYSFSVRGVSKQDAKLKICEALDKVVSGQPIHAADRPIAFNAAAAFIDVLEDEPGKHIAVSVNGWVASTNTTITGSSVSVTASLVDAS